MTTCVTNGGIDSGDAGNESGWGGDASVSSQPESALTDLFLTFSEENAERIMLDPTSRENLKFKDLLKVVCDHMWKHTFSSAWPDTAEWERVIVLLC